MLADLGHKVFLYGCPGNYGRHENIVFVETHTFDDIRRDYGDGDNRFEIGYSWTNTDFRHDFNRRRKPSTLKFIASAIAAIKKNRRDDDFLLLTQGQYQKPIADALKLYLTCESGIGYRGSFARWRAFESAYIMNFTYGSEHPYECINGNHYDRVIPNYFDENDVEFSAEKDDYYLFIGRMIRRKGILTAYYTSQALGKKLIIAGQGAHVDRRGYLVPNIDPDFELPPGTWEYVGYVDVEKRKKLMARAKVTFTPTEYLECFAGTHVESQLSGTPVITTSFGVYGGTVIDGVNGYKCHTLQDFVDNTLKAEKLDPHAIRAHAERYLTKNVKYEYQKWFDDLHNVWESSVDPSVKGWSRVEVKK